MNTTEEHDQEYYEREMALAIIRAKVMGSTQWVHNGRAGYWDDLKILRDALHTLEFRQRYEEDAPEKFSEANKMAERAYKGW